MKKQQELQKGGFGTSSLVLGIIGLIIFPVIFSTLAIIFGAIGLHKDQKFAKAGLILGIVGWVIWIIMLIFFASMIATMFSAF